MTMQHREDVRNLAIIAHVDHGKTTLTDAMLWQSTLLGRTDPGGRSLLDSIDPGREKSIPVMPRVTSIPFRGTRINIVDTPGRADFCGEVARALKMVEGVLLLVDAVEGPVPQTRFALRKALETGLAPIVILTKIDLPGARPEEVLRDVRNLFVDLDATEAQLGYPVLFTNPLRGICRTSPGGEDGPLLPVFEAILETVPPPSFDPDAPLQFLITMQEYDDFLGRLALGRLFNGTLVPGESVAHCRLDGSVAARPVGGLFGFEGTRRIEIQSASSGEIVAVAGLDGAAIGETLSATENPAPLPGLAVAEPTISVEFSVNSSPMAGMDGKYVSGSSLRERLWKELLTNAVIRVEETDSPDAFELAVHDELQLAILIEMMRREGFEFQVSKPHVPTRELDGRVLEPIELLVLDCPEEFSGVVKEKAAVRKARLAKMVNHGTGRVRMELLAPSRGLIGFRTEYLSDTRGTGILDRSFRAFEEWQGEIPRRAAGALVADRPGRATAHAIEHLQPRGAIFVMPGDQVYEGMVVGENSHADDLQVNITKEKKPSGFPADGAARETRLIPPRSLGLEQALAFIHADELVEVTPREIRLRKRILPAAMRGGSA